MKNYGFIRVAAATMGTKVANPSSNAREAIKSLIDKAYEREVSLIVFPELSISGYSCGDLFNQRLLLNRCEEMVGELVEYSFEKNMAIVAEYIAKENLSWDDFPAFKWCREKGEGWYLPSIDEVLTIGNNYNGGNRQHNDRHTRSRWNDNIRLAGGSRIDMKRIYYSSTEMSDALAMMGVMGIDLPYLYNTTADPKEPIQKYVTFIVRAVHKF